MWLPKDERRLLAGYVRLQKRIDNSRTYRDSDLGYLLRLFSSRQKVYEMGDARDDKPVDTTSRKAIEKWMGDYYIRQKRVQHANRHLKERKLIKWSPRRNEFDVCDVALTLEGYDLGLKYSSWYGRTGLWFAQFQQHWLWLLAGGAGATVLSKLVDMALAKSN